MAGVQPQARAEVSVVAYVLIVALALIATWLATSR
jgi:hypothetical protein